MYLWAAYRALWLTLFKNKQNYKYDNYMQIILMNINDITI